MGLFDAFSRSHKEERAVVKDAKRAVNELSRLRDSELKDSQKALKTATKNYERAVENATKILSSLQNPGKGKSIVKVGKVELFEHAVNVNDQLIALSGMTVRVESSPTATYLYFTLPNGQSTMASFSTEWHDTGISQRGDEVWVDKKRSFSDEQIRHLENVISAAIRDEAQFLANLPNMITAAQIELERCQRNTGDRDGAQARLDDLAANSETVRKLTFAESQLRDAEQKLEAAIAAAKNS